MKILEYFPDIRYSIPRCYERDYSLASKLTFSLLLMYALPTFAQAKVTKPLNLDDILTLGRQRAPEISRYQRDLDAAQHKTRSVDAAFDPYLITEGQHTVDKSEQQSPVSGEERQQSAAHVALKKSFTFGTHLNLKYAAARENVLFPELPTSPITPGATTGQPAYNPGFRHSLELQLAQPLLRNFNSAEVKLNRKLIAGEKITPKFNLFIFLQTHQGELEQLFWKILHLDQQIRIARERVKKSRRFRELMRKRTRIGRSDQVDVASADASVVTHEGHLLDFEIARQESYLQLASRLKMPLDQSQPLIGNLMDKKSRTRFKSAEQALAFAGQNRYDLKMLTALQEPLLARRSLAEEQQKPQLELFTALRTSGLSDQAQDAFTKMHKGQDPTWSVGLKLGINLGATGRTAEVKTVLAELASLAAQKQVILAQTHQFFVTQFHRLHAADRQLAQANRHIRILRQQETEERRKFRQARSEEIIPLRYQIEILTAEGALLNAHLRKRLGEAAIRTAIHDYPVE